jgi:hypothetical protein
MIDTETIIAEMLVSTTIVETTFICDHASGWSRQQQIVPRLRLLRRPPGRTPTAMLGGR